MLALNKITFAPTPNPPCVRRLHELRMRDPFIFTDRERGLYFLYGTNMDTVDGAANIDPYFDFYVSEDLETFYGPYMAFKPPKGYWGVKHYWAPEVHAYRGKYYMFASFKGGIGEDRGTAVLIADKPEGPFVPLSDGHVTLKGHECLDGTLLIDEGRPYIAFCHEWTELYYGKIKALPMKDDLSASLDEEPIVIVDTEKDSIPWIRLMRDDRVSKKGLLTDAPFFHRLPGGKLLMTWSSYSKKEAGGCGGYVIAGLISDSGRIAGSWRHLPELLLDRDVGHSALFRDLGGRLMLISHANDSDHGSESPIILPVTETEERITIQWPK
ncbi:MAG: glycoside hydrolase family 43 protein [Candidatus Ventricola sp.]